MHFQPGVLLVRVAQEVRHDGLVVGDVGAQRYGNRLAKAVFWDGYSTFTVVMLSRGERTQPAQQPQDPQQHGASGGPGRRHSCGGGGGKEKNFDPSRATSKRLKNHRKSASTATTLRLLSECFELRELWSSFPRIFRTINPKATFAVS